MIYFISGTLSLLGLIKYRYFVLWTLVILALFNSLHVVRQAWGDYHYYIGAKYFTELGYFDLYECSISQPTTRRDLNTYDFRFDKPDCKASFSPQRYIEFHIDLAKIGFKPEFMVDKGFNATPTWIAIGQSLINTGLANTDNLYLFDVIALLVAFPVLVWSLGWERSGYVALFVLTFYGTQNRLWGHFAQWLWLSTALIGVSLLYKRKAWGGWFIGFSASLAIFPVFLLLAYMRIDRASNLRTRLASNLPIVWGMVGIVSTLFIGLGTSRGFNAYPEFFKDMSLHSDYVRTELCCNVGLAHTITWTLNPDSNYLADCFATAKDCQQSYHPQVNNLFWFAILPVLLTSPLGAMFGLLTLSVYYYLILAVIPIWYSVKWSKALLFINAAIWLWMLVDWYGAIAYRHWLWFIFLLVLGVKEHHVIQTIASAVGTIEQRLHPQVTQRNAGD